MKNGWEDRNFIENHTQDFSEFKKSIEKYSPAYVAELTGVPEEAITKAAEILTTYRPMAVIWGVDLAKSESGKASVIALAKLQMILGNLGQPGGGLIPLRTQNNSQGACDMGGILHMFPGYQPIEDPDAREKFEVILGC